MSDTPRTDQHLREFCEQTGGAWEVHPYCRIEFARELERELNVCLKMNTEFQADVIRIAENSSRWSSCSEKLADFIQSLHLRGFSEELRLRMMDVYGETLAQDEVVSQSTEKPVGASDGCSGTLSHPDPPSP